MDELAAAYGGGRRDACRRRAALSRDGAGDRERQPPGGACQSVPPGFLLNVPTAPPAVQLVHYRVQRGDTLEGNRRPLRRDGRGAEALEPHRGQPRGARRAAANLCRASRTAPRQPAKSEVRAESSAARQDVSAQAGGKTGRGASREAGRNALFDRPRLPDHGFRAAAIESVPRGPVARSRRRADDPARISLRMR